MTKELYEEVKNEIPDHIGVFIEDVCVKKAKRQKLGVDEQILKDSMIRSLSREVDKQIQSANPLVIEQLNRRISSVEREAKKWEERYYKLYQKILEKYGDKDIL